MSKQVQRFSADVRPAEVWCYLAVLCPSPCPIMTQYIPTNQTQFIHSYSTPIIAKQNRKKKIQSTAPPPPTFLHRTSLTLDVDETTQKNLYVPDQTSLFPTDIASMTVPEVRQFIRSLGSAYERYAENFKIQGRQLITFNEIQLQHLVPVKLHRHRILMEIARNTSTRNLQLLCDHDVDVLHWDSSKVCEWCKSNQLTKLYADKFHDHGVDGMLLFELDHDDMSTIGVNKMHQQQVLEIISKFASDTFPSDNVRNVCNFVSYTFPCLQLLCFRFLLFPIMIICQLQWCKGKNVRVMWSRSDCT